MAPQAFLVPSGLPPLPGPPPQGTSLPAPTLLPLPPLTPSQLARLPHDNQGPMLLILIWTMNAVAAGFLGMRVYCKISRRRGLWWDDHMLIMAWVCPRSPDVTGMIREQLAK